MDVAPAGETAAGMAPLTRGSVLGHVLRMTATGAVGMVAIMAVDILNLLYITLLGREEATAAVGYAGTVLFFHLSLSIGTMIAVTARVSRAIGAGDRAAARRMATSGTTLSFLLMGVVTLASLPFTGALLSLLGATGETHDIAQRFLMIALPSNLPLALGMAAMGILRAAGDARRSMYVTLVSAGVIALLDPVFIFALGLGVDGAAMVTVLARLLMGIIGVHWVLRVHGLYERPSAAACLADLRPLAAVAVPAILTNLATPAGNAYMTAVIAEHGVSAVAAWTIIGRLFPLAFGGLFALSGAVGAIFGQNLGAGLLERVRRTLTDSLIFAAGYVLVVWLVLAVAANPIADLFQASPEARTLVVFFCQILAPSFLFAGGLFVANAAFNNLGFATWSTAFNWGRVTIGIIPFVHAGAGLDGARGVLAGWGLGGVVFGVAAVVVAYRAIAGLGTRPLPPTGRPG